MTSAFRPTRYVYLAGSINGDPDPRTWRLAAAEMLPKGWEALDPMAHEVDYEKPADIIRLDYGLILKSQAIIANVARPSWGTAMELAYAYANSRPVFAFGVRDSEWSALSPWLRHHVKDHCESLRYTVGLLGSLT